jgi:alpha-L-arabinofuranosidase
MKIGISFPTRFNWSSSLGPLQDRPGHSGYWGNYSCFLLRSLLTIVLVGYDTDGMGFKELLDMVEDFGATPILGVFDGYSASDESIPNTSMLDKYIQDAVNELE